MANFTIDEKGVLIGVSLAEGETAVELPSTVRAIGAKAFTSKHLCTKVTLNSECQEIREQAFFNNQTITELVIGADLSTIQQNAFAVNNPLQKIKVQGPNINYTNICKGLKVVPFLLDYKTRNTVVLGVNADEIVIPTGVSRIEAYAFANCQGLKKITFEPETEETYTIREIGDFAFAGCIGLGTYAVGTTEAEGMLYIPASIEFIGEGAFWGCSNISIIYIDGGKDKGKLHYLPSLCFGGMENLTDVYIPLSVLGWYNEEFPQDKPSPSPTFIKCGVDNTIGDTTFQASSETWGWTLEVPINSILPEFDGDNWDEYSWYSDWAEFMQYVLDSFPHSVVNSIIIILSYSINGKNYEIFKTSKYKYRPLIGWIYDRITLPTLKEEGYTFEGWYVNENYTEPCTRPNDDNPSWTYQPPAGTTPSTITLYAKMTSASLAFNYEVKTALTESGRESKYVVLTSVKNWEDAIDDSDSSLMIPETLTISDEVLPVKAIGDGCCANGGDRFTKVEIPRYITGIGYSAFENCTGLTTITFASGKDENGKEWKSSLTTIKGYAFTNTGIKEIALPDTVTSLYQGAFYNCPKLETIIINENLKSIGSEKGTRYGTFDKCPKLQGVYVKGIKEWLDIDIGYSTCNPLYTGAMLKVEYKEEGSSVIEYRNVTELNKDNLKGITEIPSFAFTGYMGLQKVDLTETDIVTIGEEAFNNCQGMTELELRNGKITTLGRAAFSFCTGVESIVIPNTISNIEPDLHAFDGCSGVKTLAFEDGITSVKDIFRGWSGLQEVTFNNSIKTVDENAFIQNTGIKKIVIGAKQLGGVNQTPTYQTWFANSLDSIEEVDFAEGIEVLEYSYQGQGIFAGALVPSQFSNLKRVGIPSSAKVVRHNVIQYVQERIFVDSPKFGSHDSLTVYDNWLFRYDPWWWEHNENLQLPENLDIKGISDNLELVYFEPVFIPASIRSILSWAIMVSGADEESPGGIKVTDIRQWASMYFDSDSIEAPYGYDLYIAPDAESEGTKVTILDIDVSISRHSFSKCNSLEKIILRDGCQEVGDLAFSRCKNVTSAYFSASVEYIGYDIFYDSLALTEITVQDISKFIQAGTNQDEIDLTNTEVAPYYELYQADSPEAEKQLVTKVELPQVYTCSLYNCTSISEIVYTEEMTTINYIIPRLFPNVSILEFKGVIKNIIYVPIVPISQDKYRVIKFHHKPNLSEGQAHIMQGWYASLNKECRFYFVGEESGFTEGEVLYDNGKEGEEAKKFIITKWGGE